MKIYESGPGMYDYKYLPGFAKFLLDNHLEEYVIDQIQLSQEMDIPLMKHLSHLSNAQLVEISKQSSVEYLGYLAANNARDQIETSLTKWLNNKIEIVGKFQIAAEDITLVNYIREKLFKKWVRKYNISMEVKFDLMDEMDNFFLGSVTSGTNTFIEILNDKIEEESHLNAQLINTSPGITFIFDLVNQKEAYVNESNIEEVLGFTGKELLGMGANVLSILTHPDDLKVLSGHMLDIVKNNESKTKQVEYRFKNKNGGYRWLRTYSVVFKRDAEGTPTHILGTSYEISKEKDTAFSLEKRELQLLEAQSIANLGSFEWDLVADTSVNTPELLKIFEFQENQGQKGFMKNVHPLDIEKVTQSITQSFITGNYDCQYRYIINEKEKVLWARGIVIFKKNKPAVMSGTVQDITQLKRIEEELIQKTKALEHSNESLQQFASIASHDLKEPLRKMSMYTDMVITLEENNISLNSQTNLKKVKSSSIRMQNMIEDILDFSSITNDARKEHVNLATVVKDACEILEESIKEKKAKVMSAGLPNAFVIGPQLRHLFQNLIANAIKFSSKDTTPEIKITYKYLNKDEVPSGDIDSADRYIQLRVADNGIGFKQEHAQKIFGLFTRLHGRAFFEGSGLGLSICKRIVENHGGLITAESELGKGATFIITLPDQR